MKKNTFYLIFSLITLTINAQTQFWSDNFENPTATQRTPSVETGFGGPPNTSYFKRALNTGEISLSQGYGSYEGSYFWAAENIDAASNGTNNAISSEQNITWSGISISGKTGLTFRGLFAAVQTNAWDHGAATTIQDYMHVDYRIDGGTWTNLIHFEPTVANASTGAMGLDSNFDFLGTTPTLTRVFSEQTISIPNTGTSLDLRFRASNNAASEEFAIDNFRLFETVLSTTNFNTLNFSIYPNPSNGVFNISLNENASIEVTNILGKQIKSQIATTGNNVLNISDVDNGLYLVKIITENGANKTVKVVKQ